jgi:hypothetical protein
MSKVNEKWVASGKSELAEFFGVSVNAVTAWLVKGCPHAQETTGRKRYRFYLQDVVAWLHAGKDAGTGEVGELSVERAHLARKQTEKTEVETQLKQALLKTVLAGGVLPVQHAKQMLAEGEIIYHTTIGNMIVTVPHLFFKAGYMAEVGKSVGTCTSFVA